MTEKMLLKKMQSIITKRFDPLHREMVKVVNEYISGSPDDKRHDFESLDSMSHVTISRQLDDIALLRGWIEDRLNGRFPKNRNSRTKKIRRALGYSIP